jgi:diguanylate cyclase (GGDEF)-like protein
LADLDQFKRINDDHSHGIGDRVLERVARIFTERVRGADLVARYGGEEFLFCFIGIDQMEVERRCEDLRSSLERADWSALSPGLRVTMSVGVASCRDESDASVLLDRADTCLYEAKRRGRNRLVSEQGLHAAAF